MNSLEILEKIRMKKEFSEIPEADILMAFNQFVGDKYVNNDKIKLTRDLLRRIYSGFGGKKLLLWKDKSYEEVLEKHLSTRERYKFYEEIYERLLIGFDRKKKVSVIDLGAGVNGFSFQFFKKIGFEVNYLSIEAVGQLASLTDRYFKKEKLNGKSIHASLFEKDKIINLIKQMKKPKIIFLFKVIDSLEKLKRDYTLDFLSELKKLEVDKIVISFATESWHKRTKFLVQRTWLINFIKENFEFIDDFKLGGERYLVFKKR